MEEATNEKESESKQDPAVIAKAKEDAETELRRAFRSLIFKAFVFGCPLGYVASYWFQDRYPIGLLEYLKHADYVLVRDAINGAGKLDIRWLNITPWVGIIVGGLVVSILSQGRVRKAEKQAKAIMTEEEFKVANKQATQISFGKTKASDQTFFGALKQLLLVLPLAILILVGLIALGMKLFPQKPM